MAGGLGAGCRWIHSNCGEQIGARVADQRAGLGILRLCSLKVLVRDIDLSFEGIQLSVLKQFPPVPAQILLVGLGGLPISHLLVGWRHFRSGAVIVWPHRAPCKEEHAHETDTADVVHRGSNLCFGTGEELHGVPPVAPVGAICTFSPGVMESGGLRMTDSLPCKPETISTESPKSRPGVPGRSSALPSLTMATRRPSFRKRR